jgi:hypothetical protein
MSAVLANRETDVIRAAASSPLGIFIATRYDRYAQNYLSGLALAAIMIAWI